MDKKEAIRVYKAYEKADGDTDWAQCGGWRELARGSFQIKSQIEVGSLLVSTTFWTLQHQRPTIRTNY